VTTDLTPNSAANNPTGASISADSRYVAFDAPCSPSGASCSPGFYNVYLIDRGTEAVGSHVAAGGTVTTDAEGDGATNFDNIEVEVMTPVAGLGTVQEGAPSGLPPQGFTFLGQEFVVSAPMGTTELPLVLVFRADSSLLSNGIVPLVVLRNGVVVDPCGAPSGASPDPCLAETQVLTDGDVQLTVRTSSASRWNLAVRRPYPFAGFFQPVENAPTLNSLKAGSAVPVKFGLGGNRGLHIFAAGFPLSQQIQCETGVPIDAIEETVNAGGSSLSYDVGSGQYVYVWKTDKGWSGCRELQLRLNDGETYRARFTMRR
jgi:hypothetical protein